MPVSPSSLWPFRRAAPPTSTESEAPAVPARRQVIDALWAGRDPFAGFPAKAYLVDLQGWNSDHPALVEAIDQHRPSLVVEVGVWKGGSAMTMARRMKALGLDAALIAVDTWLGASDHWLNAGFFEDLGFENGYPRLYHKFVANVLDQQLQDYIVPLPLDSTNAAIVVREKRLRPQVLHIDAGHDYDAVTKDLQMWWPLLAPGGVLIADDYWHEGAWPEVKRGVDDFFAANPPASFTATPPKALIVKPA